MKEFHILNGDALNDRFPDSVNGEIIVARECLIDGPVFGETLEDFFSVRSNYLNNQYSGVHPDYSEDVGPEFKRIIELPEESTVNLWFEDDLFCQLNFWFCCSLISEYASPKQTFLVRPHTNLQYGIGGLDSNGLVQAFQTRVELTPKDVELFSTLWKLYQKNEHAVILRLSEQNEEKFPFLSAAAQANLDRFPADGSPGRPELSLLDIMKETGSDEFGPVFREFHKRESIYGFGDLQVKRLFDELRNSK